MKKKIIIAAVFACFAHGKANAQVDYLEYMEEVNIMSELVISAKSCERMGMVVNWDAMNNILDELRANAITKGVDSEFALGLITDAMRKQRENEKNLMDFYIKNPARSKEFLQHWSERCAHLEGHPLTKRFIKHPG